MKILNFSNLLFFAFLVLLIACQAEEERIISPEDPIVIDPIKVDDIIYGYWQDKNHLQGFAFTEESIFMACSRQIIEYDFSRQEVIQELKCTDFPGDYCTHSHYGDIAYSEQDLWIAFHTGGWQKEYACAKNQLLRFRGGTLDPNISPEVYLLDYPGHIGAVEVIEDQIYISGKYIAPDWNPTVGCQKTLLVYQYEFSALQDSTIASCNTHSKAIFVDGKGQDGTQVLAKRDKDHLLVAAYPCKNEDNINRVYEIDLSDENFTSRIFQNENWAYGVALSPQNKLFYGEDNRYFSTIFIQEFME